MERRAFLTVIGGSAAAAAVRDLPSVPPQLVGDERAAQSLMASVFFEGDWHETEMEMLLASTDEVMWCSKEPMVITVERTQHLPSTLPWRAKNLGLDGMFSPEWSHQTAIVGDVLHIQLRLAMIAG